MITILGRECPNQMDELTIDQFEHITEISNNKDIDNIDRHLQIFATLGIPESEFFDFDVADFIDIVKAFNVIPNIDYPTVATIELDGYSYTAEMKLTVRDTKIIERIATAKPKGYISDLLAVLFKRDDLTKNEHYADAHLKLKSNLINKLKANIAIPYILFIAQKIKKQVETQQVTEVVE